MDEWKNGPVTIMTLPSRSGMFSTRNLEAGGKTCENVWPIVDYHCNYANQKERKDRGGDSCERRR